MQKIIIVALFVLITMNLTFAADLPAVIIEPFDYAEGSLGEQGEANNGWGGAWEAVTAGEIIVTPGSMTFTIIPSTLSLIHISEPTRPY